MTQVVGVVPSPFSGEGSALYELWRPGRAHLCKAPLELLVGSGRAAAATPYAKITFSGQVLLARRV
jgi:hypothetical protein